MNVQPPKIAKRIFTWYCGNARIDDLVGDMDEIYSNNLRKMSPFRARVKYWQQILSLMFSYAIKRRRQRSAFHPHSNDSINIHMIRNYFLIAWRTMTRNKVYTTINVLGLSLGVSACLLVYMVVVHEFSFDRFHKDSERIFRVKTHEDAVGWTCPCVPAPAFITLRDELAGAEAITGFHNYQAKATVADGGQVKDFERHTSRIILTDPAYFKIFQYEWLAGTPGGLSRSGSVVLTETRARTYFGSRAPHEFIGKSIAYNDSLNVLVTGVVKDWTENSDLSYTEFISFKSIEETFLRKEIDLVSWGRMFSSSQSFIKTRAGDDPNAVAAQMTSVVGKKTSEKISFQLENVEDIHFMNDEEGISTLLIVLYVLMGLAGFVLVIAAINFINLSTAQSIKRGREIGIRKVMGSMKLQIVFQFLSETSVLAFIAIVLSVALLGPLMLLFEGFLPAGLTFNVFSLNTWFFLAGLMMIVSLLAGTYPALVLSSYRPVATLNGRTESVGKGFSLRKLLIVFQFSASLFFIIATLVIRNQMEYIQSKDRGFSTQGVFAFETDSRDDVVKVKTLADKVRTISGVSDVAIQGFMPMGFGQWTSTVEFQGKDEKISETVSIKPGDDRFVPLYSIRLLAGKNISPSDTLRDVVINESLSKRLGFQTPESAIGERIFMGPNSYPIVGVFQDFHETSFHNPIGYTLIGNMVNEARSIAVKLNNPDVVANVDVMAQIESRFNEVYPDEVINPQFIEDEIAMMHGEERKISKLATIAMAVTIFISCMGVFGLAMFTAAMRTREIGIRKVLGATAFNIANMLSREFMILIIVAIVLATPVAWYAMDAWIMTFVYREDLSVWVFITASLIALVTGLVTVSYQSVKAALDNPAKALRVD